jgi:translation initiation factor 2 alpha subunit (eIF-2alpha)
MTRRITRFDQAAETITHDREKDYGHPRDSFNRIATMWSVILDAEVTPQDVALCMMALKISRLTHEPDHLDSAVDVVGYARCLVLLGPDEDALF